MTELIIIWIIFLCIQAIAANFMKNAAYRKGYTQSDHPFAICFWLGIFGFLYVIALPDLNLQKQNDKIIELLSNQNVFQNDNVDDLPEI